MKRVALLVQYDGTKYSGWQKQKNAITVQETIVEGSCNGSYEIHRTFTAEDPCLNSTTGVQIVTVVDDIAPVITPPANFTVECSDAIQFAPATALDNCGSYTISSTETIIPGDAEGKGGVFNFVTKRGVCHDRAKISWTQVETGSAVTWKYPSCILKGDNSVGEFYSVAVTNNYQQADTGTKMIHLGKNSKSTIISKGICAGKSEGSYRGLVKIMKGAENARNFSQCDSLLMGDKCGSHTFPYIEVKNKSAKVEHEATTSKIGEDQIFYCNQRGIGTEEAIALIVNGYCKDVLNQLPMEFAVEAQKLLAISLEGSVG